MCANVDPDHIALLGRWKLDAMFRCLRIQAATHSMNFAQLMLDHGAYTFAPGVHQSVDPVPREANTNIASLLTHDGLFDDL